MTNLLASEDTYWFDKIHLIHIIHSTLINLCHMIYLIHLSSRNKSKWEAGFLKLFVSQSCVMRQFQSQCSLAGWLGQTVPAVSSTTTVALESIINQLKIWLNSCSSTIHVVQNGKLHFEFSLPSIWYFLWSSDLCDKRIHELADSWKLWRINRCQPGIFDLNHFESIIINYK